MSTDLELFVVYYAATYPIPVEFLPKLAGLAREATVKLQPWPAEAELRWPRPQADTSTIKVHLTWVAQRLASAGLKPIEELVAGEATYPAHFDRSYTRDFEALKRAHAVVYLVDDQAHRFKRYVRHIGTLRADLIAAGHRPEDVPVVVQIAHPMLEGVATRPTGDLIEAISWPRCRYVEMFGSEKRGIGGALDQIITLYQEMQAERPI